jgi:hypothetical protein
MSRCRCDRADDAADLADPPAASIRHVSRRALTAGRSERTVRQHAVSVYEQSGIGGRAELAAFFLQGLLPDGSSATASGGLPGESVVPGSADVPRTT